MAADPEARVRDELDRWASDLPALGLAVSGGGDSVALLHMATAWARARDLRIEAATVDHRLRAGSASEAAAVAAACATLGVAHQTLPWDHGGAPSGNLMAAARTARRGLLGDWAARRRLPALLLGHTRDDQAETLLLRLARGAGVDGLSGMAARHTVDGLVWLRPMLGVGRAALRAWLAERGVAWADDPSNDDPRFDRVRARQAMAALGLPPAALAASAAHLAEARAALAEAALAACAGAEADRGVLRLPVGVLEAPAEIRRRSLLAGLRWVTGAPYGPRGPDLARLIVSLGEGRQATLAGVIARPVGGWVELLREPAAAARAGTAGPGACPERRDGSAPPDGAVWDGRWQVALRPAERVRATRAADLAARDWRAAGLPRAALLSGPAVVRSEGARSEGAADGDADAVRLPLLGEGPPARPLRGLADFARILRAH